MIKNRTSIQFMIALTLMLTTIFAACSGDNKTEDIEKETETPTASSPYIAKVIEYMPAAGQFVNTMPKYETGNTQADMNKKAFEAIGENAKEMVSLGGYGGYIIMGFDHTIENKQGLCDFRVLGNAFSVEGSVEAASSEPGIIMVAFDKNKNGKPDDDEWYEIAGSAHNGRESWLDAAAKAGNDVETYKNYSITYYKPDAEPDKPIDKYIRWTDNQGNDKWKAKNGTHKQPYFPQWVKEKEITFKGSRLPQNGIDKSGKGDNFIFYKFAYGYADNAANGSIHSAIDISWAVDKSGKSVSLPGADFIKIYTGVNQENGWLGESSTEIMGVEDLHLLKVKIESKDVVLGK